MLLEFYILIIPFCAVPIFLVSLDYLKKLAELKRNSYSEIDFDKFVKRKKEGDGVDIDIATLLDIEKIAT